MTQKIECTECQGTGHMSDERASEISREERRPVCWMYGCEACDGRGTVDEEVDEDEDHVSRN